MGDSSSSSSMHSSGGELAQLLCRVASSGHQKAFARAFHSNSTRLASHPSLPPPSHATRPWTTTTPPPHTHTRQSPRGHEQARAAGDEIRAIMERATAATGGAGSKADPTAYQLYFYCSPYLRSRQTYEGIRAAFAPHQIAGMQEDVQLREQDFGACWRLS